jgi:hypothetical protein
VVWGLFAKSRERMVRLVCGTVGVWQTPRRCVSTNSEDGSRRRPLAAVPHQPAEARWEIAVLRLLLFRIKLGNMLIR